MRIDTIKLHVGESDFPYQPRRHHIEAKSESRTALSRAPRHDAVNAELRDLATQVGDDAVIPIQDSKGVSMTARNSIKGTGLAARRMRRRESPTAAAPAPISDDPLTRPHRTDSEPWPYSDNNERPLIVRAAVGVLLVLGDKHHWLVTGSAKVNFGSLRIVLDVADARLRELRAERPAPENITDQLTFDEVAAEMQWKLHPSGADSSGPE